MIGSLEKQSAVATGMLKGKVIKKIIRHRRKEVVVMFVDGTKLFVDWQDGGLELSITEK